MIFTGLYNTPDCVAQDRGDDAPLRQVRRGVPVQARHQDEPNKEMRPAVREIIIIIVIIVTIVFAQRVNSGVTVQYCANCSVLYIG